MTAYRTPPRQEQCAAPLHRWHPVRAWRWVDSEEVQEAISNRMPWVVISTWLVFILFLAARLGWWMGQSK